LSSVAALKTGEISRWRKERLADAQVIKETPFIAQLAQQCFAETGRVSVLCMCFGGIAGSFRSEVEPRRLSRATSKSHDFRHPLR
jgi:hypothetical protein